MRRIGLVGRCQVAGIGDALLHLLDDCEVSSFVIQEVYRNDLLPHAEKTLPNCDIVFAHYFHEDQGFFSTENLRKKTKNLVLVPPVVFSGFQPDCIDLIWDGRIFTSPMGSYHSAIVAAAYSLGLPVERTAALFNKLIYGKLGYFAEFAKARTYLNQTMKSYGIDIAGEWPEWLRQGNFMHSYNHPKPFVLASLAKLLAVKAGLIPVDTPTPELGFDFLSLFSIWPVYPEIAETLGVKGSYVFKKNGTPDLVRGGHTLLCLWDFIEGSYEMYEETPHQVFDLPAVEKTRAVLSALLAGTGR